MKFDDIKTTNDLKLFAEALDSSPHDPTWWKIAEHRMMTTELADQLALSKNDYLRLVVLGKVSRSMLEKLQHDSHWNVSNKARKRLEYPVWENLFRFVTHCCLGTTDEFVDVPRDLVRHAKITLESWRNCGCVPPDWVGYDKSKGLEFRWKQGLIEKTLTIKITTN